ncbi:MAG: cytochrome c maturation protein CcmE [Myxococcales bacterium]
MSTAVAQRADLGRRERWAAVAAVAVSASAVAFVAWGGLGRNLVYSWDPSQLRAAGPQAVGATVRLGGIVSERSVKPDADGVSFELADGKSTVPVRHHGLAPQMFREGIAVVVEGTLGHDGVFDGSRLMVSHGNVYQAEKGGAMERPEFTKGRSP